MQADASANANAHADGVPLEPEDQWKSLLLLSEGDPAAALDQANRLLQTSGPDDAAALRVVAGVAAVRAGHPEQAWTHVSRVNPAGEAALEPDLRDALRAAYVAVVLQLINGDCGPLVPIESEAAFARLIFNELVNDEGFAPDAIGSESARSTLDLLVNDRGLQRAAPALSDFCRVAQLLATARRVPAWRKNVSPACCAKARSPPMRRHWASSSSPTSVCSSAALWIGSKIGLHLNTKHQ